MFRSCLLALLLYAAIAAGYWYWLDTVFEPPGSYWGAASLGLVVFLCFGALLNAKSAWTDWSLTAAARSQTPPRDGRLLAACGTIQPVGEPLLAPFSHQPCCLVEYDLSQQSKSVTSHDGAKTGSDLAGFLMTPSEVQTALGNFRVLGFPVLEEGESYTLESYTAARRARDFVSRTQFEDISGLRLVNVFSAIQDAWADDDGHVEKNLQLKKVDPVALFPDDLEAVWQEVHGEQPVDLSDDEATAKRDLNEDLAENGELDDDDEEDDGAALPYIPIPTLKENRVTPGEQVCVIGRYDELRRGLRPSGGGMKALRLIRGNLETLERKARGSLWSHLLGALFFLTIAHAATYGLMWVYQHDGDNQRKRMHAAFEAVGDSDLPKLAGLVRRGMDVNVRDSEGRTLLMTARNPKLTAWLLDRRIELNAVDREGNTALMRMVFNDQLRPDDRLAMVKQLIAAGADLNIRDHAGESALNEAERRSQPEIAELLRAAGAKD